MFDLGIDIGSISINTVLIGPDGDVVEDFYDLCRGAPFRVLLCRCTDILGRWGAASIRAVAFTGSGGALATGLLGGLFVNEIVAQAASVCALFPRARTIIEMGGEDTKLIFLQNGRLRDFVMNGICAAGTGSFLDQQARRINVAIESEFGRLALASRDPPRIAGRCSVFAKSDMIHHQQIATPVHDIVAGLCFAVARNVKSTLARGRDLERPVMFQGGVAANAGMVRALREVFSLDDDGLVVPAHHASMGAIGAVLHARSHPPERSPSFAGLDRLREYLCSTGRDGDHLEALDPRRAAPATSTGPLGHAAAVIDVSLGIDVGSLSTNVVLIDGDNRVIARRYLPTSGRPLAAIQRGVREVGEEVGARARVTSAGTTGSGRYLTGDFVGADLIVNEITAQAAAAVSIAPDVETIFEIGGQDSKYISVQNGVVVDFEMNKVCAAGTGSFLEEQAEKLGVRIDGEFGALALSSRKPARLGDRCTVFMESDLNSWLQRGAAREDLMAGLAYSIVQNYLRKVVGEKPVGRRILFQGGVAYNAAVVSAFEKVIGRPVEVPPHFDVTGAIGAAMLARDSVDGGQPTRFKGFEVARRSWALDRFSCGACSNACEIRRVRVEGEEKPLYYGGRCERYETADRKNRGGIPDLFEERTRLLLDGFTEEPAEEAEHAAKTGSDGRPVIGIPRALSVFHQRFPYWRSFFESLGMSVALSRPTDPALITLSLETLTAETCFPVEVMHGHVMDLLARGVSFVFLPFVVNEEADRRNPTSNCNCPWIQTYPFIARCAVRDETAASKLLIPPLHFRYSRGLLVKELAAALCGALGVSERGISRAVDRAAAAQEEFEARVRSRGKQVMASLPAGGTAMVILGRPYNTGDGALNLRLVDKLLGLGVQPIPLEYLPLEREDVLGSYPSLYWPNGRRMLQAARIVARDERLQAVSLCNFRCGPDSFISHFVRAELRGKPYLQLEMDEHSADAGLITRLEAFLDSLKTRRRAGPRAAAAPPPAAARTAPAPARTLYFPHMADGAHALAAASRSIGMKAEVLPPMDARDIELGRTYTSSRECFPMICTTGSFLRKLSEPGVDPRAVSFFMPDHNGPCRFGQYNSLQRLILDRAGFPEASIVHPSNEDSYASFARGWKGVRFRLAVWRGLVAIDILRKLKQERRPYEIRAGETTQVYETNLARTVSCVEQGGRGIARALDKAIRDFARIEIRSIKRKPVISIVGEIFMRDNPFCSGFLVEKLEALGAETVMGPVRDWISYSTYRFGRDSRRRRKPFGVAASVLQKLVQTSIEHRLVRHAVRGGVEMRRDTPLERMLELCMPYVHRDYDGDPVIALGSAAGQCATGISGVVNILPFTCLPGTLVAAVSPRFSEDHDGIPWLDLPYDGQADAGIETRLQAFLFRAQAHAERMGYDAPRQR